MGKIYQPAIFLVAILLVPSPSFADGGKKQILRRGNYAHPIRVAQIGRDLRLKSPWYNLTHKWMSCGRQKCANNSE